MTRSRFSGWNLAYLAVIALGFAAAIYHATSDRWGNAIIAAGASAVGTAVVLLIQQPEPAPATTPRRGLRGAWADLMTHGREEPERSRWLSGSILAGFLATIVGGQVVHDRGQHTGALPGTLIRGPLAR